MLSQPNTLVQIVPAGVQSDPITIYGYQLYEIVV